MKNTMNKLYVNSRMFCTFSESDGEEFGNWSESWDFYVESVRLTTAPGTYPDEFAVDWTPEVGQKVYVLSIRYSDGDSFGNASGKGEVVWVFRDKSVAEAAKQSAEKAGDNDQSYNIVSDSGKVVKIQNLGWDYFTNVYDYSIEEFTIQH